MAGGSFTYLIEFFRWPTASSQVISLRIVLLVRAVDEHVLRILLVDLVCYGGLYEYELVQLEHLVRVISIQRCLARCHHLTLDRGQCEIYFGELTGISFRERELLDSLDMDLVIASAIHP